MFSDLHLTKPQLAGWFVSLLFLCRHRHVFPFAHSISILNAINQLCNRCKLWPVSLKRKIEKMKNRRKFQCFIRKSKLHSRGPAIKPMQFHTILTIIRSTHCIKYSSETCTQSIPGIFECKNLGIEFSFDHKCWWRQLRILCFRLASCHTFECFCICFGQKRMNNVTFTNELELHT